MVKKLRVVKKNAGKSTSVYEMLAENIADIKENIDKQKQANALSAAKKAVLMREIKLIESYKNKLDEEQIVSSDNAAQFALVKKTFQKDVKKMQTAANKTTASMENAFKYMEAAFGDEQEMTLFVAELTVNRNIANFIAKHGSDAYFKHNSSMLVYNEDDKLTGEIDQLLDEAV